MKNQLFVAVFLMFNGGIFDAPDIDVAVFGTRHEAQEEVEYYGGSYHDSFVMTRDEFEAQYGPLTEEYLI